MKIDEIAIVSALEAPALFADELVAILNDRGDRDAALVIVARSGNWQQLRDAAGMAMAQVATFENASPFGPLTVLGLTCWMLEDGCDPVAMWRAVPATDDAHRMATLLIRVHQSDGGTGELRAAWLERMAAMPVATCLAFKPNTRKV